MSGTDSPSPTDAPQRLMSGGTPHFLAGAFMTLLGVALAAAFAVYRIGPSAVRADLGGPEEPITLPPEVHADLTRVAAVGENFETLAPPSEHTSFLVQPDEALIYKLRPNVRVEVVVPPAQGRMNLDPPNLNIPGGAPLANATREYLTKARLRYGYTTDGDGRRLTLPTVNSNTKVLIVGDSVAFGTGVDDEDTVASQLQALLGPDAQVVNAAVGGYDGNQAARAAELLSRGTAYAALVYVACDNDFGPDVPPSAGAGVRPLQSVTKVMDELSAIDGRFTAGVTVLLTTPLEYEARDVLLDDGFIPSEIEHVGRVIADVGREAGRAGFRFAVWSDIVASHREASRTIFSPFVLYADHVHFSPLGNRLAAEKLMSLLDLNP